MKSIGHFGSRLGIEEVVAPGGHKSPAHTLSAKWSPGPYGTELSSEDPLPYFVRSKTLLLRKTSTTRSVCPLLPPTWYERLNKSYIVVVVV